MLFVRDIASQDQLWSLSETQGKRPKSIKIYSWSPDGKTLAVLANGTTICLLNGETGALRGEFTIPLSQAAREQPLMTGIAWHPCWQFLSVRYELRDNFTSDHLQSGEYLYSISGTRLASGTTIHWNDEGSITAGGNIGITI
jgi:WD40 repeat protein